MIPFISSITIYKPQSLTWRLLFVAALGLLLLLFTGCESGKRDTGTGTQSEKGGVVERDDADIARMIDYEYVIQDGVDPNQVMVEVQDGIVTLSGTVNHILAKDRAVQIASMVKGVRGVVDKLDVYKLDLSDRLIKDNVVKALFADPATESYDVEIEVNNGHVTIGGTVESWQEGQLVKKVVKRVAGVSGIADRLNYDFTSTRSDVDIEQEIEQALQWDVRVDARNIEVDVVNGKATLSGVVRSTREKSMAVDKARVRGVESVQADDLLVNWEDATTELRSDPDFMEVTDGTVLKAVADVISSDPRVTSENVEAEVEDGRVTLRGAVDNLQAKNAAEEDAKNVVGVWSVVNLLKVQPEKREMDKTVETRVEEVLERDPSIGPYEVFATVYDGKAVLNGEVDNYFEKYRAGNLTASVEGVVMVDNNIKVDDDAIPYVFDPYSFSYEPQYKSGEPYFTVPSKSDYEIKLDVREQLEWSPFVSSDEIELEVDNGIVTLTGLVNSWKEYWMAEKNALEGGALDVHNKLQVVGFEIM